MADVEIINLRKSYGAIQVLHGIDLKIRDGEFVSLVGGSGCGKSTLLRIIAGLESLTAGSIRLGGQVMDAVAPKDRDVAMVFQNYALYPHMTVADNMGFSLHLRKVPKADIRKAVEAAAALLDLSPYLDRLPRALSGGQRQRVAMGRAIVRQPSVFLFDEPLSNLDTKLRVQMRGEIRALQKRLGTTSIYVTHDQMEAMTMSDRIVVMNSGRVEQVGAPLEVYDSPRNLFVATFIGSPAMNLIDGVLQQRGEESFVRMAGIEIALGRSVSAPHDTPVVAGVRPEHLSVARTNGQSVSLPVTVDLVEPTGAETHIYGKLHATSIIAVSARRTDLQVDKTTDFHLAPEMLHVFDAQTGNRL
ncbi:MAG TPA: sn-glycerol-3-phosphate ABC transporter ATP-binding protein UgpC [Dongiaceae bacterium]|nr:sn-glycerol-3-phosphate ABC transporter ATP-binding protein UgpC [Dongiaceae bacterium]